eukprot:6159150-Amphidinium_carterae.1
MARACQEPFDHMPPGSIGFSIWVSSLGFCCATLLFMTSWVGVDFADSLQKRLKPEQHSMSLAIDCD